MAIGIVTGVIHEYTTLDIRNNAMTCRLHVTIQSLAVDFDGFRGDQDEHHSSPLVTLVPPLVDSAIAKKLVTRLTSHKGTHVPR